MKKIIAVLALGLLAFRCGAQEGEYRSVNNPLYWKNRKPDAAYWQQDVA
ncbi:MAG: hypothetical protein ACTHKV_13195 [Flavipsychrobacter sp.]